MKVEQIMSRPAVTCVASDTANRAAQLMWEMDIGCVVVLEPDGKLGGIITDRDLCMAAYTRGAALWQIVVGDVMTRSVAVVRQDDRLGMAEALMRSKRVRRLPVVDAKEKVVGLLSLNDVARAAQHQRGRRVPEVAGEEVVSTLGAICEPRRPQELMTQSHGG